MITFGEEITRRRENFEVCGDEYVSMADLPERMTRDAAAEYYNAKLYRIWLGQMEHFGEKKEKILNFLLGREE